MKATILAPAFNYPQAHSALSPAAFIDKVNGIEVSKALHSVKLALFASLFYIPQSVTRRIQDCEWPRRALGREFLPHPH
jgi:hypothetical protein